MTVQTRCGLKFRLAQVAFASFFVTLAACGSPGPSGPSASRDLGPPSTDGGGEPDGGGGSDMGTTEPTGPAPTGPRRLSVTQLERSLDVIGNLPLGSFRLPENLALTLGRPDFRTTTERSFEPSPLFMKFMVDLGGFVCQQIIRADRERPESERVLLLSGPQDERLSEIWFRFTGIRGDAATPYIERLARVEESAEATGPQGTGALAVCLAAVTSPEFLIY